MAGTVSPSGGAAASQGAAGGSDGGQSDGPKQANTFDQVLTTISTQMAQDALNEMDQAIQDTEEDSQ